MSVISIMTLPSPGPLLILGFQLFSLIIRPPLGVPDLCSPTAPSSYGFL